MSQEHNIPALFDAQAAYTFNGNAERDGSLAIALGRTAGLAWQAGYQQFAQSLWSRIPKREGAPSLEQFVQGYMANPQNFAAFADAKNFPAAGTALSNALGSYGYALDYQARGVAALCGGNAQAAAAWGDFALQTAGLPKLFTVQPVQTVSAPQTGGTITGSEVGRAL